MIKTSKKYLDILYLELLCSFILLPAILSIYKVHGLIYLALAVLSIICALILKKYYNYDFAKDWNIKAVNRDFFRMMIPRVVVIYIALFLFAYSLFEFTTVPGYLFSFPKQRPGVWVIVMVWYPIFSVLPQEFLYRSYFYHRFRAIFPHQKLWIVSAALFGWSHVILQNFVAVSFSAIGGLFFAKTYEKTNSLAAAVIEHALYGCWLFTLGLGLFFYHGLAVK